MTTNTVTAVSVTYNYRNREERLRRGGAGGRAGAVKATDNENRDTVAREWPT